MRASARLVPPQVEVDDARPPHAPLRHPGAPNLEEAAITLNMSQKKTKKTLLQIANLLPNLGKQGQEGPTLRAPH